MADWLFDGTNKIIQEPPGSGDTQFSAERDLYSAWKRWVISGQGAMFLKAFIVEGGTPIGSTGIFTGKSIVLTNGWKVRAADHPHQVTINGNLFSDDGVVSLPTSSFNTTIFVSSSVAAQGIATGSAVTNQDVLDIKNAIFDEILENGENLREMMRLLRAEAAGKLLIVGNEVRIRDSADSKNRIVAQTDSNGQRLSVSTDVL